MNHCDALYDLKLFYSVYYSDDRVFLISSQISNKSRVKTQISARCSTNESVERCCDFRLTSVFLSTLELKAFDVKALRAFRVLRPLKLVSGVPSEYQTVVVIHTSRVICLDLSEYCVSMAQEPPPQHKCYKMSFLQRMPTTGQLVQTRKSKMAEKMAILKLEVFITRLVDKIV